MSNEFRVSNLISKGTTEFLEQRSPILNTANPKFSGMFTQKEYATGGNVDIKIPGYPASSRGSVVNATAIEDLTVSYAITEDDIYNVPRALSVFEGMFDILNSRRALTDNDKAAIVDNYAYPAYLKLQLDIETTCALRLKNNAFYSPIDERSKLGGFNNFSNVSAISKVMTDLKFGPDRYLMMNTRDATNVANSLQNMFNEAINTKITKTARIDKGRLADLDVYMSTELKRHTAGELADTEGMTIVSVSADGMTVVIDGVPSTSSQLINAGDIFSVPSVYLVDGIGHDPIDTKLTFVAAADANGNNDGTVDIQLEFPLMASGEHANVASLPEVGADVFCYPDYYPNYAYVPSGLNVVSLPMMDVFGAINSERQGNVRIPVKTYLQGAVTNLSNIYRISMLVAVKAITPYLVMVPSLA